MSINQNFTAQVNGVVITDYQLKIYNNSTNVLLYDSTKITLNPYLYDKDTLSHIVPANSVLNGLELKWTLQVWSNTETVISKEVYFVSYGIPTFTLDMPEAISVKTYNFVATYNHPQNVSIKKFQFKLYDSNNNILGTSGDIYSANTKYNFKDISFINGNTYKVESIAEDINGVIVSSGIKTFTVTYPQPSLNIFPSTEIDYKTSGVKVKWGVAKQINGIINGTVSYGDFTKYSKTKGVTISSNSNVSYYTDIPKTFTAKFFIKFSANFSGIFCELFDRYKIGYDRENLRFYFENGDILEYKEKQELTNNVYLIIITPTNFIVKEYSIYGYVESLNVYTIDQLNFGVDQLNNL
jgi:hypothetical protein